MEQIKKKRRFTTPEGRIDFLSPDQLSLLEHAAVPENGNGQMEQETKTEETLGRLVMAEQALGTQVH